MSPSKLIQQIKDTSHKEAPIVSFEFFPPKTTEGIEKLKITIDQLSTLSPAYVSVTYGAGGSTKALTYDIIRHIKENTALAPAAHLTCVNASRQEINEVAQSYLDIGVNRIVALRGDVPGLEGTYVPRADGYAYADDLVAGLCALGKFDISVAAYPETHPTAPSESFDLEHLKRKLDAGATRAITQYCFDTDQVLRFMDKAHAIGITKPIVPGILTPGGFKQLISFSQRCGASVPDWVIRILEGMDESPAARDMAAVAIAAEQCRLLMQEGFRQFHFYTLNRADLAIAVCKLLGAGK